jgi:Protein of unknown function (DUF2009)/ANCHR-like B-box zinc-binding domain
MSSYNIYGGYRPWGFSSMMASFPKEDESSDGDDYGLVDTRRSHSRQKSDENNNVEKSKKLSTVLDKDDDDDEVREILADEARMVAKGEMCIECEDQLPAVLCVDCDDRLCLICFRMLHRKGTRQEHKYASLSSSSTSSSSSSSSSTASSLVIMKKDETKQSSSSSLAKDDGDSSSSSSSGGEELDAVVADGVESVRDDESEKSVVDELDAGNLLSSGDEDSSDDGGRYYYSRFRPNTRYRKADRERKATDAMRERTARAQRMDDEDASESARWFTDRAKYIPLRLEMKERKLLRLLESALIVSEYTDKIDTVKWRSLAHRTRAQLQDICAMMSGLVVAANYDLGQRLLAERNFKDNAEFFRNVLEIGRRHKIMNPEKMRSEYGKLVYLLMDAAQPKIQELFEFSLVKPVRTVHSLFEEAGVLAILRDPNLLLATMEIRPEARSRAQIDKLIRGKERAQKHLSAHYANSRISADQIKHALYSIGDNHSYLAYNRDPVHTMIDYLRHFFRPEAPESDEFALGIEAGAGGARLTHSHERQYVYCLQSLTLWAEIANDMYKLWYLAEQDLLDSDNPYALRDTGQGLQRVQQAPRVWKAMQGLLHRTQRKVGAWVGSAVVHLGDANVPNALMFIDKYTQVSRILNPIMLTLNDIDRMADDGNISTYLDEAFGGAERAKKIILTDFFRHAFDGSGADNFYDAGSCIDGRLTSAWNWCSTLANKPYYNIFKLAGFLGFDGSFKK